MRRIQERVDKGGFLLHVLLGMAGQSFSPEGGDTQTYASMHAGTLALEPMEVVELVLYAAGITSSLAAAYVAATYLRTKSKSKRT